MRMRAGLCIALLFVAVCAVIAAAPRPVTLATTTSVQDTGLLDALLPGFEKQTGIDVKVIAVGTGQALELARRGDADVALVHAPDLEREFMRQGHSAGHWRLMYNYFVIVGPAKDPAQVRSASSAAQAMKRIADAKAPFVSRGDKSGTNVKELALWKAAKVKPAGDWYIEAGQGMAATLRLADEKDGYTLSDIGTYLSQKSHLRLVILYERNSELLNQYSLMAVNPKKHPSVNYEGGMRLIHYFLAPATLKRIAAFGVDRFGQPLFWVYRSGEPARRAVR
jgi:tungstate transport system substrate-binding protein